MRIYKENNSELKNLYDKISQESYMMECSFDEFTNAYNRAKDILSKVGKKKVQIIGSYGFGSKITEDEAKKIYNMIDEWDYSDYFEETEDRLEIDCSAEYSDAGDFGTISIGPSIDGDSGLIFVVAYNEL